MSFMPPHKGVCDCARSHRFVLRGHSLPWWSVLGGMPAPPNNESYQMKMAQETQKDSRPKERQAGKQSTSNLLTTSAIDMYMS